MPRKDRRKVVIAPAPVPDDFKRIKGIGPAIEKHLHAAGILTYADLAKLTPFQVSERTGGLSAKVIAKKRWIKQAAKLASESAGRPFHRARFRIDLMLDDNDIVHHTRVKHIKHEEDEAVSNKWDDGWGYWSEEKLINFFVQHAGIKPQSIRASLSGLKTESTIEKKGAHTQESEVVPEMTNDQLSSEAQLSAEASTSALLVAVPLEVAGPVDQSAERTLELMDDSLLSQVSPVATPVAPSPKLQLFASDMQVFDSPIRDLTNESSVKLLRAQFSFQLSDTKANEITTAQLSYFVQILACELSTGHMTVLATGKQMLQPGSMLYTPTADFALPGVGRYQTFGVIFLSIPDDDSISDRARVDVAWGPIINIIP
jgi:hypothetical protein